MAVYNDARPELPMKIMHVFITMPVGGAEDLALSLVRSATDGNEVEVVCLRDPGVVGLEAQKDGLPVHDLPVARRKQFSLPGLWRFSRWLKEQRVDVVHSHVYNSHQYAVPAAMMAGIPCVLHHHKTFNPDRRRRWFILRLLSRRAACHVTLSEQTRTDLIAALAIPPERVVCLSNTVDTTIFKPAMDPRTLKAELGLPLDRPIIGGIASLSPQKNHPATIRMLAALRDRTKHFQGIICGEGGERSRLEEQIAAEKMGEQLELPGNKRPLHPWLQAMDLLVFPSTWEGQPMVLLQAMACEIPVIASDVEGNVATLGANHPGLFKVESDEDYLRLVGRFLNDPSFANQIREHQRRRFGAEPTLTDYVGRLNSIYRGLTSRPAKP